MSTLELPDWMRERMDKKAARKELEARMSIMLESELAQNDANGYVDVTIGRASQILRMPISRIGESLDTPATRQRMQNYKARNCVARVTIMTRFVEIISGAGKKLNQGAMP